MAKEQDQPSREEWLAAGALSPDDLDDDPDRTPMTEHQADRLRELCARLNEPFDKRLTQAEADRRIADLNGRAP